MTCIKMVGFFSQVENRVEKCIVETSKGFEDFLSFLGEKVVLKDWQKFRGGLDIKSNKKMAGKS